MLVIGKEKGFHYLFFDGLYVLVTLKENELVEVACPLTIVPLPSPPRLSGKYEGALFLSSLVNIIKKTAPIYHTFWKRCLRETLPTLIFISKELVLFLCCFILVTVGSKSSLGAKKGGKVGIKISVYLIVPDAPGNTAVPDGVGIIIILLQPTTVNLIGRKLSQVLVSHSTG